LLTLERLRAECKAAEEYLKSTSASVAADMETEAAKGRHVELKRWEDACDEISAFHVAEEDILKQWIEHVEVN
jgi:hypothetical protein